MKVWEREPVALLALLEAALALVLAFGVDLSGEQVGAIVAFSAVVLGVGARARVTPSRDGD